MNNELVLSSYCLKCQRQRYKAASVCSCTFAFTRVGGLDVCAPVFNGAWVHFPSVSNAATEPTGQRGKARAAGLSNAGPAKRSQRCCVSSGG